MRFFLILLIFPYCSFGQITFQKTYGGALEDQGICVLQTDDDGYIVAGFSNSFGAGGDNIYVVKTGESGDTLWTKTYGGNYGDLGYSVKKTFDDNYLIVGSVFTIGGEDEIYLIKVDVNGGIIWSKAIGDTVFSLSEYGWDAVQTADSGFIILGETQYFGAGGQDIYLIKVDGFGNIQWTKTYGGPDADAAYCVQETNDGGFIIAGWTFSYGAGDLDIYLIKTNAAGDTLWTKTYGWLGPEWAHSVQQTLDGGYIITGATESMGAGSEDLFLLKIDSIGNLLWASTYGGADIDAGLSVRTLSDGSYIVVGYTYSYGSGGSDIYLIKFNQTGIPLWAKTYGKTGDDFGYSVEQTSEGGFIVAGTYNFAPWTSGEVYLIKTDANGNSGCNESTGNPITGQLSLLTNSGGIVLAGGVAHNYITTTNNPPTTYNTFCFNSAEIVESNDNESILLHPNPTSGEARLIMNLPAGRQGDELLVLNKVQVFDLLGRPVPYVFNIQNSTLSIESLPAGVYFVRLGEQVIKVVKQ